MTDESSSATEQIHDPYAAVRVPEFRNLILGRFTFIMSLRMMSTLVGWWVYLLINDPFAIGLIGLSEVIPAFSLAPYAGHVIDNSEKRGMLRRGISLYTLVALLLLFISTPFSRGHLHNNQVAYIIYALIFCTGIIRAFTGPVFSAILALVVPRNVLQNATTWSQGSWLAASVTGHAVGGFLIALIGITGTLIVISCLQVLAFIIISRLGRKPPFLKKGAVKTWESVKEGLRFVFRTKEILGAFSLDMFAVLFGGAVAMIPVYARTILHVGAMGYGMLNAAIDIGSIIIIIILTFYPMKRAQGRKLLFAVAGFGCCIILFALSKWFLLSFTALLIAGMVDGVSVVVRGTVIQLKTPDHMRGRVSSVGSMFISSSNELGQFESGVASRIFGVVPSVVFGGAMTLVVVLFTWFKAPSLRKFEY